jgi:hypothetical protein
MTPKLHNPSQSPLAALADVTLPLACAAAFARQAARQLRTDLDPDDAAQEVALLVWEKMQAGAEFGADGRTRNYVKNAVRWQASEQRKSNRRFWAYTQATAMLADNRQSEGVPLSAPLHQALAQLPAHQRELLWRVAVCREDLGDIGDEVALARAAAAGVDWNTLPAQQRAREKSTAYQTVFRRYRRTCAGLKKLLLAG